MQIKVGTDIIVIARVKESIEKFGDKFLNRFLNKSEIKSAKNIETIAGYWAAKEAIAKALGCGIGKELSFLDIEIYKDRKGAPYFKITKEGFFVRDASLSISHDGGFAIATTVVIVE